MCMHFKRFDNGFVYLIADKSDKELSSNSRLNLGILYNTTVYIIINNNIVYNILNKFYSGS